MEHIKVIELSNNFKKLIPDKGYILKYNETTYSEAIVKNTNGWKAIKI